MGAGLACPRVRAAGWPAQSISAFTHSGAWDEIVRRADELRVDAIVLGARGLTGVGAALGSVSDAVVHTALRARELLICHVSDGGRDSPVTGEAIAEAASAGFQSRGVLAPERGAALGLAGRAWRALVAAAQEHEAAVVVVGSRGRTAARELTLGSVAMGVLHHAERPVIVAPPTTVR